MMQHSAGGHLPVTVLLVDDHPVVIEGLRSILDVPDVQVVGQAGSGDEAVKRAARLKPQVVVLDVMMPGMDGLAALRAIKAVSPQSAVVMLTMSDELRHRWEAVRAGAAAFLSKGQTTGAALLATIRQVAAGEEVVDLQWLNQHIAEELKKVAREAGREEHLSPREMEMLHCLSRGMNNQEIAEFLKIERTTVKGHMRNLFTKINVSDRTQALIWGYDRGLLKPEGKGMGEKETKR